LTNNLNITKETDSMT